MSRSATNQKHTPDSPVIVTSQVTLDGTNLSAIAALPVAFQALLVGPKAVSYDQGIVVRWKPCGLLAATLPQAAAQTIELEEPESWLHELAELASLLLKSCPGQVDP